MKVVYWSDYVCPFCYIGVVRLKKSAKNVGIPLELEIKAFQLDPTAENHTTTNTVTRFAEKYNLSKSSAAEQIDAISQMGQAEGIDFKYSTTLFTNTMDAHRLTKLAFKTGGIELTEKMSEKFYSAYFTDNLELADHSLLKKIGLECGLNADDIDNLLTSDQFRDEVILDEREAMRYGIHAVPYFVIDNKFTISGAQSIEVMTEVLNQALKENSNATTVSNDFQCGPNGC